MKKNILVDISCDLPDFKEAIAKVFLDAKKEQIEVTEIDFYLYEGQEPESSDLSTFEIVLTDNTINVKTNFFAKGELARKVILGSSYN